MKRQYFTRIELLIIVVVILSMLTLTVIISPRTGVAREKARRISCASNLKQMAVTMFMYAGDFNDKFPIGITTNSVATKLSSTVKGLNLLIEYNYLSDQAIYNCPSTTDYEATDGNTITTQETARTCSYVYAPGLMTGSSNIYGNPDSALVADMTGVATKRQTGNHDKYGNIIFQGIYSKLCKGSNHNDWFLLNYGSTYDPITQKGNKDSSWSLTGQYLY